MLFVSELLSKPVLSLAQGRNVGIIKDIFFDSKLLAARALEILCEDENDVEEKLVLVRDIFSISDAVTIKNDSCVLFSWSGAEQVKNSPMNALAYSVKGEYLGRICDIALEPKHYNLLSLKTDTGATIPREQVLTAQSIVIVQDAKEPIKLAKPVKKIPKNDERRVQIARKDASLSEQPKAATDSSPTSEQPKVVAPPVPPVNAPKTEHSEGYTHYRILIDNNQPSVSAQLRIPPNNVEVFRSPQREASSNGYSFLLNRQVKQDITDSDNKVIIPAGTIINLSTIETAKASGKIVQLALNS